MFIRWMYYIRYIITILCLFGISLQRCGGLRLKGSLLNTKASCKTFATAAMLAVNRSSSVALASKSATWPQEVGFC